MSAIDRSELDGYETLVSELRATAPVAPERLRERVLEGAPAQRVPRSRKRRLFLVVVPVAAVLAVGAALVHGFLSTGSRPSAVPAPIMRGIAHRRPVYGSAATASQSLRALPSGSQSADKAVSHQPSNAYSGYEAAPATTTPTLGMALSGNGARSSVMIPQHRLVHAVATLQVQVSRSKLSEATNSASQIVGSLGGYAQSVHYEASHQGGGSAVLTLRVPVQKAEAAIAKLGALGKLLSQQVSTQDLQTKLTHQTSAIGSLRRAIAVYEQALQSTTLPASQRVIIQIRLNNARRQLSKVRHARAGTLAFGATADISLLLTTSGHAFVGGHHKSGRFNRLLGSAAGFLGLEGIIVLYALIVVSPLVLLGTLAWWILRERRRREERLLASA
ncbi:MAG TPA: DUF4349 domain-containing protein [Gaiellaceae bacterium]|nr:DUF4349 domain-containing protein [Gaiellaceae bacterium]